MENVSIGGLSKVFGQAVALDRVDLEVKPGEFVSLLGPSGCGKTTTLRCVAGLETPTAGRISVGDDVFVDIAARSFVPPNRRNVGMVFQSYALWPNRSVLGNVTYPLRLRGGKRKAATERAERVLSAVGLDHLARRFPHELSGGQQQRVALARGLVSTTKLMLFDEPLSNLDAKLRLSMRGEIRRLHDEFGHTSLYVTHDQAEALAMSDRIVVMNDGRIEQSGTPGDIFRRPRTPFVASFIGMENIFRCVEVSDAEGVRVARCEGGLSVKLPSSLGSVVPGQSIAFRAADVRFGRNYRPDDDALRVRGRVAASSYTGDGYTVALDVEGGRLACFIPDDSSDPPQERYLGETLEAIVPKSAVLLLDEQ